MTDYDMAKALGRKAFFERATMTIRKIPENYCLAYKPERHETKDRRWRVYTNEHATKAYHDAIQNVLDQWQGGSTGDALADEIGKLFDLKSPASR